MDTNVLRNFLAVAELGNITYAAESLLISQPALSMQIKRLEEELDSKLFERHSRFLTLTTSGQLLKERATAIVGLMDKTVSEFKSLDEVIGGEIRMGCAESELISSVATAFADFRCTVPRAQLDITSGGTEHLLGLLHNNTIDLAVIVEPPQLERYNYFEIPGEDTWGAIVPEDDPLAAQEIVTPQDLRERDIIISRQSFVKDLPRWGGADIQETQVVGFYNLAYNGAHLTRAGVGVMLSFDRLIETRGHTGLVFRPLSPPLSNKMYLIWQKQQTFTPVAQRFLKHLRAFLT